MLGIVAPVVDPFGLEVVGGERGIEIDVVFVADFLPFGLLHNIDIVYNGKEHIFDVVSIQGGTLVVSHLLLLG